MTNPEIGKNVLAGGVRTNYIEAGSGSPLVLIHGSGPGVTAFANWNGVLPKLSEQFHCYAPDMVGFGYTETPQDVTDFTLDYWVHHIVGFLDALGIDKAAFIGNSFGGALSLALASRHPDRVSRFVLMGPAGLRFDISPGLEAVWSYQPSLENMRSLMTAFAFDSTLVTDVIVRSRHEASTKPGAQEAFARLFPQPRQARLDGLATPEAKIRTIAQPALIIHGREDIIVPVEIAYRFSKLLQNSELHVFGECGHWTQIEKRSRFLDVVLPFLTA
jgi:2-hydroxymuconate-semialdehyde hydrolase